MLNTLYHIEGYIIGHNHVIDYLDQYLKIKKSDAKQNVENGIITLEQYSLEMDKLEVMKECVKELSDRFESVRNDYLEILAEQRKNLHGKN